MLQPHPIRPPYLPHLLTCLPGVPRSPDHYLWGLQFRLLIKSPPTAILFLPHQALHLQHLNRKDVLVSAKNPLPSGIPDRLDLAREVRVPPPLTLAANPDPLKVAPLEIHQPHIYRVPSKVPIPPLILIPDLERYRIPVNHLPRINYGLQSTNLHHPANRRMVREAPRHL